MDHAILFKIFIKLGQAGDWKREADRIYERRNLLSFVKLMERTLLVGIIVVIGIVMWLLYFTIKHAVIDALKYFHGVDAHSFLIKTVKEIFRI